MRHPGVRIALALAGLAMVWFIVRSLGVDRVAEALVTVAAWLPLAVVLEIAIATTDVLALRGVFGAAIPLRAWLRSGALAYATSAVLPAGRAAGEAARASILKNEVGLERAVDGGACLQTASLYGTAFISLVGAVAATAELRLALAINAVLCLLLGVGARFLVRLPRLRRLLGGERAAPNDATTMRAAAWCVGGRFVQALQYGLVLHAVGGLAAPRAALVAQGVHVVGATVGDAVPNQLGITEGAYRVFAEAVGLGDSPARAVSIALSIRVVQLGLAAVAWCAAMVTRRG